MLNAQLTPDYAIQSDSSAQNLVIKRRRIVDPTLAPTYKADPTAPIPQKREVWDDAKWYPVTTDGLRAALDYVRLQSAVSRETSSLPEFIQALQEEGEIIKRAISQCIGDPLGKVSVIVK